MFIFKLLLNSVKSVFVWLLISENRRTAFNIFYRFYDLAYLASQNTRNEYDDKIISSAKKAVDTLNLLDSTLKIDSAIKTINDNEKSLADSNITYYSAEGFRINTSLGFRLKYNPKDGSVGFEV